jgi:hypothetical protein
MVTVATPPPTFGAEGLKEPVTAKNYQAVHILSIKKDTVPLSDAGLSSEVRNYSASL